MSGASLNNGQEVRIGVYVCHCGTNIAKTVDVLKASEIIGEMPGVIASRHYRFMCSDPGQELIQKGYKGTGT